VSDKENKSKYVTVHGLVFLYILAIVFLLGLFVSGIFEILNVSINTDLTPTILALVFWSGALYAMLLRKINRWSSARYDNKSKGRGHRFTDEVYRKAIERKTHLMTNCANKVTESFVTGRTYSMYVNAWEKHNTNREKLISRYRREMGRSRPYQWL